VTGGVCGSCFFSAMVVVVLDACDIDVVPFHEDDEDEVMVGVVGAAVVVSGGAAGVDGF